uniref:Uncharacterized protein n=1 Tax=Amphimedon queenslandica TaxID=400682 RepID=A0A1X7T0X8_AMPQE
MVTRQATKENSQSALSPLAKTFVVSKSPASEFQELNNVIGSSVNRITCKRKLDCTLVCTSPGINSPAKRSNIERGRGVHNLLSSKSILHHKQQQLNNNNNNNNGLNK